MNTPILWYQAFTCIYLFSNRTWSYWLYLWDSGHEACVPLPLALSLATALSPHRSLIVTKFNNQPSSVVALELLQIKLFETQFSQNTDPILAIDSKWETQMSHGNDDLRWNWKWKWDAALRWAQSMCTLEGEGVMVYARTHQGITHIILISWPSWHSNMAARHTRSLVPCVIPLALRFISL